MRGARQHGQTRPCIRGIIPAYAGSTHQYKSHRYDAQDHPRVCGEHKSRGEAWRVDRGSSPRMRGARRNDNGVYLPVGIIPAYAGSTLKDPCNPNNMIDKISDF